MGQLIMWVGADVAWSQYRSVRKDSYEDDRYILDSIFSKDRKSQFKSVDFL